MKHKRLILTILAVTATATFTYFKSPQRDETVKAAASSPIVLAESSPNELTAWVAWWNAGKAGDMAIDSIKTNGKYIDTILPMWYRVSDAGNIIEIPNAYKKSEITDLAKSRRIKIIATITNDFKSEVVSALLNDDNLQTEMIDYLVDVALINDYVGWDLDLENLDVVDRDTYSFFVKNLSEKLHENDLVLSVTVQPKTGTRIDAQSTQAHDWKTLGEYADQIRIMAYDYHYDSSEAGAIIPIKHYLKIIEVARKDIPQEKIVMGLPTYGYNWVGTNGSSLQYLQAKELIKEFAINPSRDVESKELVLSYVDGYEEHEVWYEDVESTKEKVDLANENGIFKFSFWRLGGEDPRIWDL